jgi:exonuclease III
MIKDFTLATWNVRGMIRKVNELNRSLQSRRIDIAVISETKKKERLSRELENYIVIYSGIPREQSAPAGVVILVGKGWKSRIRDANRCGREL